jgi:hypothetical protein
LGLSKGLIISKTLLLNPNSFSFLEDFRIFRFNKIKNSLKDLNLSGVLIFPLKIKEIKYKPNLSCIMKREVVLPCLMTLPILSSFWIYSNTCLSLESCVITK